MNQESLDEQELLQTIYGDELKFNTGDGGKPSYQIDLSPNIGENETGYVKYTLKLVLGGKYPETPVTIQLSNIRGFSEANLHTVQTDISERALLVAGSPAVYELIELAKDKLLEHNKPQLPCSICLYDIGHVDPFLRTSCYHFFHKPCLARYIWHYRNNPVIEETVFSVQQTRSLYHTEEERLAAIKLAARQAIVSCPVCREALPDVDASLTSFIKECDKLHGREESCSHKLDSMPQWLKDLQVKNESLFKRQLGNGGIIDLEAKAKVFRIPESSLAPKDKLPNPGDESKENEKSSLIKSVDSVPEPQGQRRGRGRGKAQSS